MRKDLFDVLKKFSETNSETLDKETKRYLERSITEGKQDGNFRILIFTKLIFLSLKGLHLDETTRDKVKELKKKLSDLQLEFSKNVNEENSKFPFKLEELG